MLLPSHTPGPAEVKCPGTAQSRSCSTSTSSFPEVTHRPDASRLQHTHFYIRGQSGFSKHNANNPSLILPLSQKIMIEKPKFNSRCTAWLFIYYFFFFYMTLNKSHQLFSPSRYTNRSGFSFKIDIVISASSMGKFLDFLSCHWQRLCRAEYIRI